MSAFLTPSLTRSSARRSYSYAPRCCAHPPPSKPIDDSVLVDDTTGADYLQALLNSLPPPTSDSESPSSLSSANKKPSMPPSSVVSAHAQNLAAAKSAHRPPRDSRPPPPPADVADQFPTVPNGLPDSGPVDFLNELLPLLAEDERRAAERENLQGEEKQLFEDLSLASELFASMHRSSGRLNNLRPYTKQREREVECVTCKGTGMVRCAYCKGEGFVDLGENGEKFDPVFENNYLTLPKKVMGSTYHCPLCGGLTEERCEQCFGTGKKSVGERAMFEARDLHGGSMSAEFDLDEFFEAEKDRIEIGLDGTVVLRARKVKKTGRKPKKSKADVEDKKDEKQTNVKKKRGRPRKAKSPKGEVQPRPEVDLTKAPPLPNVDRNMSDKSKRVLIPTNNRTKRSTDFVNTTNYKVGRTLISQERRLDDDEEFTAEFKQRISQGSKDE